MKKQSQLQKLASLTKSAWSPYAMNPDNTGSNPISHLSGGFSKPSKPIVTAKQQPKLNRNAVKVGNLFNYDNLIEPTTIRVGEYISNHYPPTPAGIPYRIIQPIDNSNGLQDDINTHTDLLNRSGLYSEELSPLDSGVARVLSRTISPKQPIYQVDARDAANWMYNRRGLKLTDEMWGRANKARQDVTSQLNKIPQAVYYAWSNNDDVDAYSLPFNVDKKKNNQSFNVFNPNYFDQPYWYGPYNGFTNADQAGQLLDPWQRFMNFQDTQDHELSHSLNDTTPITLSSKDSEWVGGGQNKSQKGRMFFRRTNNPEQPYYDDDTTNKRYQDFRDLFANTYLQGPSEYIGAMGRVKRYGAELGYDTTNPDTAKARAAMAQTLHYLTTHPKPEELSWEQQRINSWLNTAATNHMLKNNKQNEEFEYNSADKANYIKDLESPFYRDVLEAMTDATIQGLVRNDTPSNNTRALNNLRYNYA